MYTFVMKYYNDRLSLPFSAFTTCQYSLASADCIGVFPLWLWCCVTNVPMSNKSLTMFKCPRLLAMCKQESPFLFNMSIGAPHFSSILQKENRTFTWSFRQVNTQYFKILWNQTHIHSPKNVIKWYLPDLTESGKIHCREKLTFLRGMDVRLIS